MIIEIDNIELNFGSDRILYGVYLKGELGKVTGILGRNCSGKTCLLKIIFGSLNPKYKTIRINGKHQRKALFRNIDIAYLPQHQLFPKALKLATAFAFFSLDWEDFVNEFDAFKIYRNAKTNELSSGELRVVETYLILNSKKSILLLDEPFSFIAPLYVEKFKELINKRKKESIIIITDHFYRDILDVSETVYLLKNGYSKMIRTKTELENEGYISFSPQ